MPTIETPKEFPIQPETYENLHDMTLWEIDTEIKKLILGEFLKVFSFLEPLCKNADECFKVTEAKRKEDIDRLRYHGSIPDVILTVGAAFAPTTKLVPCGDELLGKYLKDADLFASLLKKRLDGFLFEMLRAGRKLPSDLHLPSIGCNLSA